MKKTYFILIGVFAAGLAILTTSFSDEGMTPEQKQQMQQIEDLVNIQLDSFRMVKDEECKARALEVAIVRADSIMAAASKTIVRKPLKTTKKGVEPTPVTPEVPKTTDPKKAKMEGGTSGSTTEDKKAKMSGEAPAENTAKKKAKMKGGGGDN